MGCSGSLRVQFEMSKVEIHLERFFQPNFRVPKTLSAITNRFLRRTGFNSAVGWRCILFPRAVAGTSVPNCSTISSTFQPWKSPRYFRVKQTPRMIQTSSNIAPSDLCSQLRFSFSIQVEKSVYGKTKAPFTWPIAAFQN